MQKARNTEAALRGAAASACGAFVIVTGLLGAAAVQAQSAPAAAAVSAPQPGQAATGLAGGAAVSTPASGSAGSTSVPAGAMSGGVLVEDPTVAQAMELARRRKARELEADTRAVMNPKADVTADSSVAPPVAPAVPTPPARKAEPPRLWSLTALGSRVKAEVFYDGRIYLIDGTKPAGIGPWAFHSLTPDRLVLSRGGSRKRGALLELAPPARGVAYETYFGDIGEGKDVDLTELPAATRRAANLPFSYADGTRPSRYADAAPDDSERASVTGADGGARNSH